MYGDRKPSFLEALIAGGVAGTSVDILFFPIDTIKTRLQSSQGFLKAGGFSGMYKGIGSVTVGSAPGAAAFFSTYEMTKQSLSHSGLLAPVNHMLSASLGEVVACLIRVPTEVIKTRTQTSIYGERGKSSLVTLRTILTEEAVRGLYRGFGITILREIPFTSLQFPLYEFLKLTLSRRLNRTTLRLREAAACGSLAGGVAAALTTPLDVLKTRVMLDLKSTSQENRPSLINRAKNIYASEGPKAFFSGVIPRTLWISAGGAVFLGVYEWCVNGLIGI